MGTPTTRPATGKIRGRRPHRQQALVREMRSMLLNGDISAGQRIPIRTELQSRFGASCITIQRVVDRFVAEGLLEARGSLGTFIAEHPPHLHRIALVFPHGPQGDGHWRGYYRALLQAAERIRQQGTDLQIVQATRLRHETPAFRALQDACTDGLLAGMIFASPPEVWEGTPVADAPMARISLSNTLRPDVVQVHPDHDSFIQRAALTLAARGCRRPAVIANIEAAEAQGVAARWDRFFLDAGIPLRPQWLIGAHLDWPGNAARLARLLTVPWAGERPDGLVVADDAFEEPVLSGLMSEGVRVGSDLVVVSLANFPLETGATLPVVRLGFDVGALLRHAVAQVQAMRAGGAGQPLVLQATAADGSWHP